MTLDTAPERIVYFGDSLSDQGELFDVTSRVLVVPIPPESAGYSDGRFSNGDIQSEVTPDLLGIEADSYAVGGARAVGVRTIGDAIADNLANDPTPPPFDPVLPDASAQDLDFDINLGGQIGRFLTDTAANGPVDGTAAAFFIGLNDYANFEPTSELTAEVEAAALVASVVGHIITSAATLGASGAVDTVLLYNLPGVEFFPFGALLPPEQQAMADRAFDAHNAGLEQGAALLRQGGLTVEIVDTNRIAAELIDDAATFGLLPEYAHQPKLIGSAADPILTLDAEGQPAAVVPENPLVADIDPSQLMFWDLVHPTTVTHGVLGAFAAESLRSETYFRGAGDDVVGTGDGRDLVLSGGGADRIDTFGGDDVVLAGVGDDRVSSGSGDDIVAGGSGDDWIDAGAGNDVVAGSTGRDVVYGGEGSDLLVDGLGWDRLGGGLDDDAFLYREAALAGGDNGSDGGMFRGGQGHDTLYLALSQETQAQVAAELVDGADTQCLASIDVITHGIESFVFVDPSDPAGDIVTAARIEEADAWGFV